MITGPIDTIKHARRLRSEMSVPERLLWRALRLRPQGFKFRRQHPAGTYVLDFYCASARLAIEVDGWAHDTAERQKGDGRRSAFLRSQGIGTVRVPAKAILDNVEASAARIAEICLSRVLPGKVQPKVPLHQPAAGPPPRTGEASL